MNAKKKKHLVNLVGGGIVVLWLVMIGLLVKKNHFKETPQHNENILDKRQIGTLNQRDWMEIFLKGKKIGYSVNQVNAVGQDYLIQEDIFLRLNLMGQANGMHVFTRSVVGNEFLLKSFIFRMTSGVVTFLVSGKVEDNRMLLEIGEGAERRKESIQIATPPVIGASLSHFFKGRSIEEGQSFKFPVFDPSTLAQKEIVMEVKARERLAIHDIEYPCFRLEAELWGQPMTFWLDENGAVLKEQGIMGLTLVRASAANAPRGIEETGGEDFYELAAIPVAREIRDVDDLTHLKLKVEGLDRTHFDTAVLNSGRQKFRDGIIEIFREKVPEKGAFTIPYPDRSGEMKAFLQPEINIESDDTAIIQKAHEIVGDTADPVAAARRLMAWVYGNIEKRPVITVPSALEVMKTRVGDCNEHAVLLTALLRASGIPARLCVGLVYTRGRFFYHAWTEGYLGALSAGGFKRSPGEGDEFEERRGGWISLDATLNQIPVDSTHIKFAQGGLDGQVEILGLIGKLRLEVIACRYD
jgi:hypothetical protein